MEPALSALRKVNFEWTAHVEEIWVNQRYETAGLQTEIRGDLDEALGDLVELETSTSPLGIPILGPAGSGKTHILGVVRRNAIERGSYFILADMTDVADFWDTVLLGYLRSLQQPLEDGRRQVDHWLERMLQRFGKSVKKGEGIPRQRPPGLINRIEELMTEMRRTHRAEVQEHADVVRALVLYACDHVDINDLGYKWLQGIAIDTDEHGVFGFRQKDQTPSRIVRGISWLLSLTGPTVLALDQLDAIVAEHELARGDGQGEALSEQQRRSFAIIQGIAGGLRELRDVTRRTLSLVSSLEATWDILDRQSQVSMADRFGSKLLLKPASGPEPLRELVAGRLQPAYAAFGFEPPYASFPFGEAFFELYRRNTPREVLKACDAHRRACRKAGVVAEAGAAAPVSQPPQSSGWRDAVSARIADLAARADIAALLADDSESVQDALLEAACKALLIENPAGASVFASVDRDFMGTGNYDPLHARVRLVLSNERERELHQSFRFLEKSHHRAFQARLKAALTASGIDRNLSFRGLTILRVSPVPTGAATEKLVAELAARGGRLVAPSDQELAMLLAIKELFGTPDEPPRFEDWLSEERPVSRMEPFRAAVESLFGAPAPGVTSSTERAPAADSGGPEPHPGQGARAPHSDREPAPAQANANPNPKATFLPIGRRVSLGGAEDQVGIPLDRVPYHTCVFAGSGSGKTVFLKRVIEEAALLGIPSIVIDGANDLSRLGTAWPERPDSLTEEDQQKATHYLSGTEVVIWTPGASNGNPLRLSPLPDFAATGRSEQEREADREAAIEVATSSIADMIINQTGGSAKRQIAILKATLRQFARHGGTIRDLAALLREPPEEVIEPYEKGDKLARDLAELLYAELESDPLIGGSGTPLDPSVLFRSSNPGKTRVSVLSLVGLPGYDRKRRFVDQLTSSLFSWIKKHPAPPGGLLGLFVLDEAKDFVPSGKKVPGKENVTRLAAQARKYGLGLLFATQEPKSIEHSIVSNCSTLLGGKMSSPTAIGALEQLLSDKGARSPEVGKLKRGTFYFATGNDTPQKISTSLCLSYHPSTPPSEADVLEAARRSAATLT